MGKDQNAKGGLVCAHPAFSVIAGGPLTTFMGEDQNGEAGPGLRPCRLSVIPHFQLPSPSS
jgi:hypothetical protein